MTANIAVLATIYAGIGYCLARIIWD